MKKIICVFLVLAASGCMFIVREEQNIKSVGISQPSAQERVQAIDAVPEAHKKGVWPFLERNTR